MNVSFLKAVATLVGTIIGVGVFAIPFVFSRTGFWIGTAELLALGALVVLMNLLYGEVILKTKEKQRLVGFAGKYLGQKARTLAAWSSLLALWGAGLALEIVGGKFLAILFNLPEQEKFFGVIFFILAALLIIGGIKRTAKAELYLSFPLLAVILAIFFMAIGKIQGINLSGKDLSFAFLPYGVLLFALSGETALTEMEDILAHQKHRMKNAIIAGVSICAAAYFLFALSVVGVSGTETSQEAITGLASFLGGNVLIFGAIFGVLSTFTTFLTTGLYLKNTFLHDFKKDSLTSNALALAPIIVLYFFGFENFIKIIGFIGGLFFAINSILMILIHKKVSSIPALSSEYSIKISKTFRAILILIFILGAVYSIYEFLV